MPDGDFYDPNGYYFDKYGYDEFGGYYDGLSYVPGKEYADEYYQKYYEMYGEEDEYYGEEYNIEDYVLSDGNEDFYYYGQEGE